MGHLAVNRDYIKMSHITSEHCSTAEDRRANARSMFFLLLPTGIAVGMYISLRMISAFHVDTMDFGLMLPLMAAAVIAPFYLASAIRRAFRGKSAAWAFLQGVAWNAVLVLALSAFFQGIVAASLQGMGLEANGILHFYGLVRNKEGAPLPGATIYLKTGALLETGKYQKSDHVAGGRYVSHRLVADPQGRFHVDCPAGWLRIELIQLHGHDFWRDDWFSIDYANVAQPYQTTPDSPAVFVVDQASSPSSQPAFHDPKGAVGVLSWTIKEGRIDMKWTPKKRESP